MNVPRASIMAVLLVPLACSGAAWANDLPAITPEQFRKLHGMVRVQPDEQRFWRIPWSLTIAEARAAAAREGKPIFVWAGAGGAPIGVC